MKMIISYRFPSVLISIILWMMTTTTTVGAFVPSSSTRCTATPFSLSHHDCLGSTRTTTCLYGVLSRSQILRATASSSSKKKKPKQQQSRNGRQSHTITTPLSREYVRQVLREMELRQERILDALERELHKKQEEEEVGDNTNDINYAVPTTALSIQKDGDDKPQQQQRTTSAIKQQHKENKISQRQTQVNDDLITIGTLQQELQQSSKNNSTVLDTICQSIIRLGYESLLDTSSSSHRESWISMAPKEKEFGRPSGFEGLLFYSPLGVPILVSQPGRHSDEVMRRISQQTAGDLWFQHSEYCGSRVLLRTSCKRGTKNSKACIQMSADLAAYYSDDRYHRHHDDRHYANNNRKNKNGRATGGRGRGVPIMYTDPKHVAAVISRTKGGGSSYSNRVGQMKRKKSLGQIRGYPEAVQDIAKGKEP